MADGIKTLGSVIKMSTEAGSPQAFVTIGNVVEFSRSGPERNIIPASNLSSAAASKLAGLLDEGEFSFTINYDPATSTHQNLETAMSDGGTREWSITLTDSGAAEIHFNGILRSMSLQAPFDDKVTRQIVVAITGAAWIGY